MRIGPPLRYSECSITKPVAPLFSIKIRLENLFSLSQKSFLVVLFKHLESEHFLIQKPNTLHISYLEGFSIDAAILNRCRDKSRNRTVIDSGNTVMGSSADTPITVMGNCTRRSKKCCFHFGRPS